MTAIEYYKEVFNPSAAAEVDSKGLYDLKESAVEASHVIVADKVYGAYHFDENFEHKKLFNPDHAKGYRQRHDFILVNIDNACVEVFLLEMKSKKDDFQHIRNQLQGGIAAMSFTQRLGLDKALDVRSFGMVRFYAAVLFHTKRLPEITDLKRFHEECKKRKEERRKYDKIPGVVCVENNVVTLAQLRKSCKKVSLDWQFQNVFAEFP